MTLAAAQVIDAIAARITGLAATGARVYTDRAWPLAERDLPAWKVYSPDEGVEPQTVHSPFLQAHQLQVELHGLVRATAGVDDSMNVLASQALTALFNTPGSPDALSTLGGKVTLSTRRIERAMKGEAEASLGLLLITLRAQYHTLSNAPDTLQ